MLIFKKGEKKQISKHFTSTEFECKCNVCNNDAQYLDEGQLAKLELVREKFGKAIIITSGYRCPANNKAQGGALNSTHMSGLGTDISPATPTLDSLDELYEICMDVFDNIGNGINKKFIHVDNRPAKPTGKRTWRY